MEIKLTNKQKILLEGLVRTSVFLFAFKKLSAIFLFSVTLMVFSIPVIVLNFVPKFISEFYNKICDTIVISEDTLISFLFLYMLLGLIFNAYLIVKLCGIHKYFSKFNFWKSFIMLIIITIIAFYFCCFDFSTLKLDFEDEDLTAMCAACGIIPSYLVYLFFNFLTKKFPMPFEKIGYFFSLEFYKNLGLKLWKKLRKIG